jgi:hypothetical protein
MSQIGDGFTLVGHDPVITLVTTTHPVCKACAEKLAPRLDGGSARFDVRRAACKGREGIGGRNVGDEDKIGRGAGSLPARHLDLLAGNGRLAARPTTATDRAGRRFAGRLRRVSCQLADLLDCSGKTASWQLALRWRS